jgi:hypothetical protein
MRNADHSGLIESLGYLYRTVWIKENIPICLVLEEYQQGTLLYFFTEVYQSQALPHVVPRHLVQFQ